MTSRTPPRTPATRTTAKAETRRVADILPELPGLVPGLGVLGVVVWLLVHTSRQASSDRRSHDATVTAMRAAHTQQLIEQVAALREHYDAQLATLRQEVDQLRRGLAEALTALESERRARWKAEDAAAEYRRRLGLGSGGDG